MSSKTTTKKPAPAAPVAKKITAAAAINAVMTRTRVPAISEAGLKELRKILEHNDAQTNHMKRVAWHITRDMLHVHGWTGTTVSALNTACREQLGRASYTRP